MEPKAARGFVGRVDFETKAIIAESVILNSIRLVHTLLQRIDESLHTTCGKFIAPSAKHQMANFVFAKNRDGCLVYRVRAPIGCILRPACPGHHRRKQAIFRTNAIGYCGSL